MIATTFTAHVCILNIICCVHGFFNLLIAVLFASEGKEVTAQSEAEEKEPKNSSVDSQ